MGFIMIGFAVNTLLGPTCAGRIFDKTGRCQTAFILYAGWRREALKNSIHGHIMDVLAPAAPIPQLPQQRKQNRIRNHETKRFP